MKQTYDAEEFNTRFQFFRYSKNYVSLSRGTRLKMTVNTKDLTCLLATVRTLNAGVLDYRKNGIVTEIFNDF